MIDWMPFKKQERCSIRAEIGAKCVFERDWLDCWLSERISWCQNVTLEYKTKRKIRKNKKKKTINKIFVLFCDCRQRWMIWQTILVYVFVYFGIKIISIHERACVLFVYLFIYLLRLYWFYTLFTSKCWNNRDISSENNTKLVSLMLLQGMLLVFGEVKYVSMKF